MNILDSTSSVKFRDLAKVLKEQISQGIYKPGDMIPAETELGRIYNVSRITVRNAVNLLVNDGLLRKERGRGKGTVVLKPESKDKRIRQGSSFGTLFEVGRLTARNSDIPLALQGIIRMMNIWESNINVYPFVDGVDQLKYVKNLVSRNSMDGLFLWSMGSNTSNIINYLSSIHYPFVLMSVYHSELNEFIPSDMNIPMVSINEMGCIEKFLASAKEKYNSITVVGNKGEQTSRVIELFSQAEGIEKFKLQNIINPDVDNSVKFIFDTVGQLKEKDGNITIIGSEDICDYFHAAMEIYGISEKGKLSVAVYKHYNQMPQIVDKRFSYFERPFENLGRIACRLMQDIIDEHSVSGKLKGYDKQVLDMNFIDNGSIKF